MLSAFRDAGFSAELVPYYYADEGFDGEVHAAWQARVAPEEIFLKAALIAGPVEQA